MKRIIIIGLSGAGKTTLAGQLSKRLGIPHTELDSIYHQENWSALDTEEFRDKVFTIAPKEEWILCGNYYTKLGKEFWLKADTVIWCDYRFRTVLHRLLKRTLKRSIMREELWHGNRESLRSNFLSKDSVVLWMLKSRHKQKKRYEELFDNPEQFANTRLIRLKNHREVKEFLKSIH